MNSNFKNWILIGVIGALAIALFFSFLGRITKPTIPRIIIVQNKPQEWADALKLGLHDGLREQGLEEGIDVVVIPRSAAGVPGGLTGLAEAVARQDAAVIYTLGTQASEAVFNAVKSKPIVFGAVTDPIKSKFYDGSLDKPNANITGTQDLWPYPAQFDLIVKLIPNLKKIGLFYNQNEINSLVSMQHIRRECKARKLEVEERVVTEDNQIPAAIGGLLDADIGAFFIPADNTAQAAARTIIENCKRKKVPVFTGISGIVELGAIGTVGTNYYELGRVNARQIAEIIRKKKKASEIPVSIADKGDLYLNLEAAKEFGITISEALKAQAFKIFE